MKSCTSINLKFANNLMLDDKMFISTEKVSKSAEEFHMRLGGYLSW